MVDIWRSEGWKTGEEWVAGFGGGSQGKMEGEWSES